MRLLVLTLLVAACFGCSKPAEPPAAVPPPTGNTGNASIDHMPPEAKAAMERGGGYVPQGK